MTATEYTLSFKKDTFSSANLIDLISKDLGVQKNFITSGSHKTIRYTSTILKALQRELEKERYFEINDSLNQDGQPKRSSFTFVIPAHSVAPDTMIWRFSEDQQPPDEIFNILISHPNFVFGYAEDEEDSFRQNTLWPGNYGVYNLEPANVKWIVDNRGRRIIDISDNPGREAIVKNARLAIGWKMWFGPGAQEYFPKNLLLSFEKAYHLQEHPNGVIEVQLFREPKDALLNEVNRGIQKAFRRHIGMDKIIKELEDEISHQIEREIAARRAAKMQSQADSKNINAGFFARLFKRKRTSADLKMPGNNPVSFAYKTWWFVVKTEQTEKVSTHFPGLKFIKATWEEQEKGRIFISAAVNGWTFIKGNFAITDEKEGIEEVKRLLTSLSREFSIAAFFANHRVVSYYSWAFAENGKILRGYSEVGSTVLWDTGEKLGIERDFLYPHEAEKMPDSFKQDIPDEEMVLIIASDWSLDPRKLNDFDSTGFGLIGNFK